MNNYTPDVLPPVELPTPPQNNGEIAHNAQETSLNISSSSEKSAVQAIEQGVPSTMQLPPPPQNFNNTTIAQKQDDIATAYPSQDISSNNSSINADDSDRIEKEWVVKSKEIIARTKNDPRRQTTEIGKIKAEYQRKRYNRDVKVSEE